MLSEWIDRVLMWLKWPVALAALAMLPGALISVVELLRQVAGDPLPLTMFLAGFGFYTVLWWAFFRRSRFSLVLTIEHELTHALFALLTFHRVTGLRATAFRGGQMTFVGKGNWLITIAPYFFPTLSVIILVLVSFLPSSLVDVASLIVGLSFAYHLTSTLRETHLRQTDIQKAGVVFCLLFLPTANALTFGTVLGFIYGGWPGSSRFLFAAWRGTMDLIASH